MINFLNLGYFVKVAEEGNITKVAEAEHVSQQSLSNHIKKIETEYGVPLFDRTGALSLTFAGERLYEYSVKILALKNNMDSELVDMKGVKQGTLRIGITYTQGSSFLPEILPEYHEKYPYINISVFENNSQVLEEYLARGHIDLYIGSNMRPSAGIEVAEFANEKLYIVLPRKKAKEIYNSDDIFINNPPDKKIFSDCGFLLLSTGNEIRKMFDAHLDSIGKKVNIVIETENIETLFALSCKGMGATVYPEMFMKKHIDLIDSGSCPVSFIPIDGEYGKRTLSIGYMRKKYLSYSAKEFINTAREKYKK